MTPLPNDITRCYGVGCDQTEQCLRFLTLRIDRIETLSYVNTLIDKTGKCRDFLPLYPKTCPNCED